LEVRVAHASAVIVQHVPHASKERFLEWQRGIAHVAEGFAGYAGTDIYPPADASRDEWVVVMHFDDDESLEHWLTAPVRERWIQEIQAELGHGQCTNFHGGFADWFTKRIAEDAPPADWKMALAVLLGLYPTVMLLALYFPGPYTHRWGMAISMLIGNALSVSALQWVVMPVLNKLLGPWLQADAKKQSGVFYGGIAAILVALAALCVVFRELSS
jgi:antibiotic biosynthesis monooxygenase (ABM) superfamily enzyme